MKCPKCKSDELRMGVFKTVCNGCGEEWSTGFVCQHEPANFATLEPDTFLYTIVAPAPPGPAPKGLHFRSSMEIDLPFRVCRLCGVFYTDLDAVAAGEKKYQEAQAE